MGAFLAAVAAEAGLNRLMPSLAAILLVIAVVIGSVWQGVKGWDVRLISSGLNVDAPRFVGQKTSEILSRLFNHQILFYREGLSSIVSVGQRGAGRVDLIIDLPGDLTGHAVLVSDTTVL